MLLFIFIISFYFLFLFLIGYIYLVFISVLALSHQTLGISRDEKDKGVIRYVNEVTFGKDLRMRAGVNRVIRGVELSVPPPLISREGSGEAGDWCSITNDQ